MSGGYGKNFDDQHVTLLSDPLFETAGALRTTKVQLKTLIQFGRRLASEYDPKKLVMATCVAARSLLRCTYAGVVTAKNSSLNGYVAVEGKDATVCARLKEFFETPGSLDWVNPEVMTLQRAPAETGPFPQDLHICAVPISRPGGPVGALLLAGANQPDFEELEGEIAALIAAQAAAALENTARLLLLERRTADLQNEINERERLHEEVRQLNGKLAANIAALTASNNDLELFTYSLAHDLRAPIRHIDAFSRFLWEELGSSLEPATSRYLERVRQNATQMGGMVDDLLRLARTGRMPLKKELLDLNHLVEEVRRELDPEFQNRRIEWRVGTLPSVEADYRLMHLVFTNLISNALKFTRPKEVASIEVGAVGFAAPATIYVRDNGVGFDMKYADKLFGIFQRLHPADQFEGTGVGLATVHRAIQKLGGRVWAESKPGGGSTFFFTIGTPAFDGTERSTGAIPAGREQQARDSEAYNRCLMEASPCRFARSS